MSKLTYHPSEWISREFRYRYGSDLHLKEADHSGIDLNRNGEIEDHEVLTDLTKDGRINAFDKDAFFIQNRQELIKLGGIFAWGRNFPLVGDSQLRLFLELEALRNIKGKQIAEERIQASYEKWDQALASVIHKFLLENLLTSQVKAPGQCFEMGLLVYQTFSEMGIFYGVDGDYSVAAGIHNKKLDCDESATSVAGVLSAFGCATDLIAIYGPSGHAFLKIDQTNLDQGRSVPDEFYLKRYSLSENSSALNPLSQEERVALHYWVQGNMYYEAELYDLAKVSYQKAILFSPENAQFAHDLAITYDVSLDYEKAIQHYLKAFNLGKTDQELLENLSLAYKQLAQEKITNFFSVPSSREPLREFPLASVAKPSVLRPEK